MQWQIHKILVISFTFYINWSYHWLKTIADDWGIGDKFGVIGLLHFQKGIWPSQVAQFPFQEYILFRRIGFFILENYDILILKVVMKNLYCFFFCTKTQHSSILNYSAVSEWGWKRFKSIRGLSGKLLKHL